MSPGGVDVLVVAFGAPDLLDRCLGELGGGLPVVVVDNSSDAAVRAVVERHHARYIDPGRNLGFAAGVNLGLTHHRDPDDLLLLNPDAAISAEGVARLQVDLHGASDLACVAPAQIDPETGEAARVSWPFPTPLRAWLEALGLGRLGRQTGFLIGSVLLIRASALAEVGPMDERFFLYSEETDWQWRAHRLGWQVRLSPDTVATHVGAGTGGERAEREAHFHASNERYTRKHYGALGWAVLRTGVMAGSLVRALVLPGERGRRAAARFHLYRTGPVRAEAGLSGRPDG